MSTINLTVREQELLCAVVQVMKASIDWHEVAKIAEFNTAKQARDKWPAVRSKLTGENTKKDIGGDGEGEKKKSTATPRKRKAVDNVETPDKKKSKKVRAKSEDVEDDEKSGKHQTFKSEDDDDDDDDDEIMF